ncbi:MAG: DUF72 domain-containing protein, partial [Balneolaceae bacterium]
MSHPIRTYHIGLTQWGYKEWKGSFFTSDARPEAFLKQYAGVFNSVEGNTTFYRSPDRDTVRRWASEVPDGFKFCFKFPQTITHYKRLKDVETDVLHFLELFEKEERVLGPFHIQLSSQFSFNEFDKLETLVDLLPPHLSYALEVRHPDFFDRGRKERLFEELLTSAGIDRVIFDTRKLHSMTSDDPTIKQAKQKKPATPVRFDATGAKPFVRFVGANDVLNNEPFLKEWAIIVADWIREGLHPYVFIHAPNTLHAP